MSLRQLAPRTSEWCRRFKGRSWLSSLVSSSENTSAAAAAVSSTSGMYMPPAFSQVYRTADAFIKSFPERQPIGIAQVQRSVFNAPIRPDIMHRAIVHALGQQRGLVLRNAKSRAETRGSGRKIRPQKGCGAARVRDRRSPIFVGGGRAFPRKFIDFRIAMNRKELDFAVRSALSSKYSQDQLVLIGSHSLDTVIKGSPSSESAAIPSSDSCASQEEPPKNIDIQAAAGCMRHDFEQMLVQNGWLTDKARLLFVLEPGNEFAYSTLKSIIDSAISDGISTVVRNNPSMGKRRLRKEKQRIARRALVHVVRADTLNCYDILAHDYLILTDKALQYIEQRYHVV